MPAVASSAVVGWWDWFTALQEERRRSPVKAIALPAQYRSLPCEVAY